MRAPKKTVNTDLLTVAVTLHEPIGVGAFKDLVDELVSAVEEQGKVDSVMVGMAVDDNGFAEVTFTGAVEVDEDEDF